MDIWVVCNRSGSTMACYCTGIKMPLHAQCMTKHVEADPSLPHSIIPLEFAVHDESLSTRINELNETASQMNQTIDVERNWIKKSQEYRTSTRDWISRLKDQVIYQINAIEKTLMDRFGEIEENMQKTVKRYEESKILDVSEFELTQLLSIDVESTIIEPIMTKLDYIKNRAGDWIVYETSYCLDEDRRQQEHIRIQNQSLCSNLTFSDKRKGKGILLSNEGKTAQCPNDKSSNKSILVDQYLSQGLYHWKIKYAIRGGGPSTWIGVARADIKLNDAINGDSVWYVWLGTGYKQGNNKRTPYTDPFSEGDVIGVEIVYQNDVGSLWFYRNGLRLEMAFDGIPTGVKPAVYMHPKMTRLSIVDK